MLTVTVWYLLVLVPIEAAGRQAGPFATHEECQVAERAYNAKRPFHGSSQSICVKGVK